MEYHRLPMALGTRLHRWTAKRLRGRRIPVDDHRLYLQCRGNGTPSVIIEPGWDDDSSVWGLIQARVSGFTRVCIYDRRGLGKSDPAIGLGTSRDIAEDLRALLRVAGVEPPYVLVGHSFGGANARMFAHLYPDDVAGMVLVDSAHEAQCLQIPKLCADPDVGEPVDLRESYSQLRAVTGGHPRGSLGDIPLVVLSNGRGFGSDLTGDDDVLWQAMQAELAQASSRSVHAIAERSDHFIQWKQPGLTVEAIRQVVETVRRGDWDSERIEEALARHHARITSSAPSSNAFDQARLSTTPSGDRL